MRPVSAVPMPTARLLRVLWSAICASGLLLMVVFGALADRETAPLADSAEGAFYVVALVAFAATAGAFALVRAMETRLLRAGSDAEAEGVVRSLGIAALAVAELPAICAGVAAFLTGDPLVLAFGATLFGFAALTWPSDDRVAHWLGLHRRG